MSVQFHIDQDFFDAIDDFLLAVFPAFPQWQSDVVGDVEPIEESSILKEVSDSAANSPEILWAVLGDLFSEDLDLSRIWRQQADDMAQGHALAGARSPENHQGFTLFDLQR